MPEGIEYLHCVQAALDASGLRCQVLDTSGQIREWLAWPLMLPPSTEWPQLACGNNAAPVDEDRTADATLGRVLVWHFAAICSPVSNAEAQTLLCGVGHWPNTGVAVDWSTGSRASPGRVVKPSPGRSPHLWLGPVLPPDKPFEIQIAVHTDMGPGGQPCEGYSGVRTMSRLGHR